MLIIWLSPEIHFPHFSVRSLPDTYTSCPSPPPSPPAFVASSSHLLLLAARVPNEALWECSLAPSPKIDLFAFCCFWGAAGTDCLPHRTIWPGPPRHSHTREREKKKKKKKETAQASKSSHTCGCISDVLQALMHTHTHTHSQCVNQGRMNICGHKMIHTHTNV